MYSGSVGFSSCTIHGTTAVHFEAALRYEGDDSLNTARSPSSKSGMMTLCGYLSASREPDQADDFTHTAYACWASFVDPLQ
jgi:hypothetical protein